MSMKPEHRALAILLSSAVFAGVAGTLWATLPSPSLLNPFPGWVLLLALVGEVAIYAGAFVAHAVLVTGVLPRVGPWIQGSVIVALTVGNAAWFWCNWELGVRYQSWHHTFTLTCANTALAVGSMVLYGIALRRNSARWRLAVHLTLVAWIAWCGLPYLGEQL